MYNTLFIICFICYFRTSFMITLIIITRYIILSVKEFNLIILKYTSKIKNISTISFGLAILFATFYIIYNIISCYDI